MHLVVAVVLATAAVGQAPALPDRTPYDVEPVSHTIFTASAFGLLGLFTYVVQPRFSAVPDCVLREASVRCDPTALNPIDRWSVGNDSPTWRKVSDIGLVVTALSAAAGTAADAWGGTSRDPAGDFYIDTLVIMEAVAVTSLLTYLLKATIRRPRPLHWGDASDWTGGPDDLFSFPSGHTSTTAAIATAYATTFGLRHPDSPWQYAVYGGAVALTLLTGYARIGGGRHFVTDVVGGIIVGALVGFFIPYLNRRTDPVDPAPITGFQQGQRGQPLMIQLSLGL